MFSDFTIAVKSERLFLAIFQSFEFYFRRISPPEYMFQKCFKSLFSPFQCKNSLRSAKNVVFSLFCILVDRPEEGTIAPPSGYASVCELKAVNHPANSGGLW